MYFDYKERDEQKPLLVLASLVKQLTSQIPQLPAKIEGLYDRLVAKGKKKANFEDLYAALCVTFN